MAASKPQAAQSDPGSSAFKVERYPFYLLNRTASRYNSRMEAALRPLGLDVPAWRVLVILGEASPRGAGEIAEQAVIPISTMTRILQRMARAGLVSVLPQPGDRRARVVALTGRGAAVLDQARPLAGGLFAQATDGFNGDDLDALKGLLDRLHVNLASS